MNRIKNKNISFFNRLSLFLAIFMCCIKFSHSDIKHNNSDFIKLTTPFKEVFIYYPSKNLPSFQIKKIKLLLSEDLLAVLNNLHIKPLISEKRWSLYLIEIETNHAGGFYSPHIKDTSGNPVIFLDKEEFLGADSVSRQVMITHELIHLIQDYTRSQEELWVEEGVALLAEHLVTGFFSTAFFHAFDYPEVSLKEILPVNQWNEDNRSQSLSQYGQLYQYFYYLYRLCGKDHFFKQLLRSSSQKTGISFLDEILPKTGKNNPICASFAMSFKAFQRARFFPQVFPHSAYIFEGVSRARIREKPLEYLPPYSAQAYPAFQGHCLFSTQNSTPYQEQKVDRSIEKIGTLCLEIRLR